MSHSSLDKPTVRRIRTELEDRGISVWLDEVEIRVGDSIPQAVADALASSDALVLFQSENAARSLWVTREFNVFVQRMIAQGKPIYPCRLDETPMPMLISDIKFANFSRSFDDGMADLLNAFAISEETEYQERKRAALAWVRTELEDHERAYLVVNYVRGGGVFIGDRRETQAPYSLLDRAAGKGLLDRTPDRYEINYDLTRMGREVLAEVDREVDLGIDPKAYPAWRYDWDRQLSSKDFFRPDGRPE